MKKLFICLLVLLALVIGSISVFADPKPNPVTETITSDDTMMITTSGS